MRSNKLRKKAFQILIGAVTAISVTCFFAGCAKKSSVRFSRVEECSKRDLQGRLVSGGISRTYLVHLPPAYDRHARLPVVLAFHGGGGAGEGMMKLTGFNRVADREGFVVVYPNGLSGSWNDGRPEHPAGPADDVGFVKDLTRRLARDLPIDKKRIYATGMSNGGLFSFRLALEIPEKIAAIASVSATMGEHISRSAKPSLPVSILLMPQTQDPFIPYNGGEIRSPFRRRGRVLSVRDTVDFWVKHNCCASSPVKKRLLDADPDDGTRVRMETYLGGREGSEVVVYVIEGGGHTWPGGWQYLSERIVGRTSREIDASCVIWEFFKRHARAGA